MEVRFARCPIEIARTGPSDFTCGMRKKSFDPDGIRTRVAALKGPCPRPLDDGAWFDIQIKRLPRSGHNMQMLRGRSIKAMSLVIGCSRNRLATSDK